MQELAGRELQEETEYGRWLEQKHPKLVCGQEMTNASRDMRTEMDGTHGGDGSQGNSEPLRYLRSHIELIIMVLIRTLSSEACPNYVLYATHNQRQYEARRATISDQL